MTKLDQKFWDDRWKNQQTGWDIGDVSPAIADYIELIPDKQAKILIPGCGNAYEARHLIDKGFQDITLVDISPIATSILKEEFDIYPQVSVYNLDFFRLDGRYDYIIEQTFFCALDPDLREAYAQKMSALLSEGGLLFGLMFDTRFENSGPPYGGEASEYLQLFEPFFSEVSITKTDRSIAPRQGTEVFIELKK